MKNNYVINIGRQLGSGGREIGKMLADKRNLSYYDRELLNLAAQESGLSKEFFEQADEQTNYHISGGIFGMRFPFSPDSVSNNGVLSNESLFQIQSEMVHRLAEKESCLFVGRCTDYILRDFPRCINVFVSADKADRIKRVMDNYHITETKAVTLMEKIDKKRAEFYNYYSLRTWGAAKTYHLCINSSMLGVEGTVELINDFADKKLTLVPR